MKWNTAFPVIFLVLFSVSLHARECIFYSKFRQEIRTWEDRYICDESTLRKKYSPGSLFKIFLIAAGYHFGLLGEKDRETLKDIMKHSDNSFFLKLLKNIPKKKLLDYLNENFSSYFPTLSPGYFHDDFSYLHAGNVTFTPAEILNWFKLLSTEKREEMVFSRSTLLREQEGLSFYGKSGTWDGAAWFCGIYREYAICSLVEYKKPAWQQAKEKSYDDFIKFLKKLQPST